MPSSFWSSEKAWAEPKCDKGKQQKTALVKVYCLLRNLHLLWQIGVHMLNVSFPCASHVLGNKPLIFLLRDLLQQPKEQFLPSQWLLKVLYSSLWANPNGQFSGFAQKGKQSRRSLHLVTYAVNAIKMLLFMPPWRASTMFLIVTIAKVLEFVSTALKNPFAH